MPKRIYRAAIYCRLSREDGDKLESNSIASQRAICEDFIARHEDIELAIEPFVDDGYSGVSFERPEFNRLMNDIRTGRIRCLVVRDLSRFGRDYIETGTYLEHVFPKIGLRFISVKDRFDSFDRADGNESLVIPLQNMINTLYSKDISRKGSTAVRAQMEQETFRNLPYGYRWDTARTSMVIDVEAAKYVRMMFQWKIGGLSMSAMLDRLEEMGASNPELRKRQVGTRTGEGCSCEGWHKSTVYGILTNPNYVGDTVLGRSERAIYKGVRSHNIKDKDAWIIFPGTHEAIISREDFQRVQAMMDAASDKRQRSFAQTSAQRTALTDFFEGKIICADCGRRMYFHRKRVDKSKPERWYAFYECSTAAMGAVPGTISGRTDWDRTFWPLSSSRCRRRWTMTGCWTSSGAAPARPRSGTSRTHSLPAWISSSAGWQGNGPVFMTIMWKVFWTRTNTPLPNGATMNSTQSCLAAGMKPSSAGPVSRRPCPRTTSGSC